MHVLGRWSMVVATLLLCGGCAQHDVRGERAAEATSAVTTNNGIFFNGIFFNGIFFNGVTLDPLPLAGLRLRGHPLPGVSLAGGTLVSAQAGDLTGAELAGTLTSGASITLRIDAIAPGDAPDISLYTVSYRTQGGHTSLPLCGADATGAPVAAIPLAGAWDTSQGTPTGGAHVVQPSVFTFACQGYALAKCVELGYAPWRKVTECRAPGMCHDLSLAPFHQACTRMLRADYCGDGTSATRNGTVIDTWDDMGLQADAETSWDFEAEWGEGGASCLLTPRHTTIQSSGEAVLTYIHDHCPARYEAPGCGGPGSTFFTASGYAIPLTTRVLLRTRVDGTAVP